MKKPLLFIALFLLAFSIQSFAQRTVHPSGKIITKSHDLKGFSGISISSDFKAYVSFGNETTVQIEADDNMHEYIIVEMRGDKLSIGQQNNLWVKGEETMIARITVPSLSLIEADEDVMISLENKLKANTLEINLNEDSMLKGELEIGELAVNLEEDSYLTVTGHARKMVAKLNEDSYMKNYDFVVGDLDINLLEDSMAALTVENTMSVSLREDSQMNYKGSPKVTSQHVHGDSELRHVQE